MKVILLIKGGLVHVPVGSNMKWDRYYSGVDNGWKVEAEVNDPEPCLHDRVLALDDILIRIWQNDEKCTSLIRQVRHLAMGLNHFAPAWFQQGIAISHEDASQVSYAMEPAHMFNNQRRRRASWAKALKQWVNMGYIKTETKEIASFCQIVARHGDIDENIFQFKILRGDDLYEVYQNLHISGNCMAGEPFVQLWANNPETVSLLAIYEQGGLMGRALIWKTDQGATVLDRIYPDDTGKHIEAAVGYAKSQGWVYRVSGGQEFPGWSDGKDYTVSLKKEGTEWWPYADSFKYLISKGPSCRPIVLSSGTANSYIGRLESTEGGLLLVQRCVECREPQTDVVATNRGEVCRDCREREYAIVDGDWIHRDDLAMCGSCKEWCLIEDISEVNERLICSPCLSNYFRYIERIDEYVDRDQTEVCWFCSNNDIVEDMVTDYDGCYVCPDCLKGMARCAGCEAILSPHNERSRNEQILCPDCDENETNEFNEAVEEGINTSDNPS